MVQKSDEKVGMICKLPYIITAYTKPNMTIRPKIYATNVLNNRIIERKTNPRCHRSNIQHVHTKQVVDV